MGMHEMDGKYLSEGLEQWIKNSKRESVEVFHHPSHRRHGDGDFLPPEVKTEMDWIKFVFDHGATLSSCTYYHGEDIPLRSGSVIIPYRTDDEGEDDNEDWTGRNLEIAY